MNSFVVIPALDEAHSIGSVIDDLVAHGLRDIVVCDDGSTDGTGDIARARGVHVVRHPLRRGAGAAVRTGIEVALLLGAEAVVLVDGDAQHLARDARRLLDSLTEQSVDVALGNRMHDPSQIPFFRRQFNRIGTALTRVLGGVKVSDSQCGLRALTAAGAHQLPVRSDGFEFCSEMIRQIGHKRVRYAEIPVSVVYHERAGSKGQSLANGLVTAWRLLLRALG